MRNEDNMNEEIEEPNEETRAAMAEFDDMIAHPERYKRYRSVGEMFEDILKED